VRWAWLLLLPLCCGEMVRADNHDPGRDTALEAAVLAAPCSGCHRAAPADDDGIPSLTGLTADEIGARLLAYKRGEKQGTLMNRLARGYSDAQIAMLADALGTATK
jgi:sulfide dehydrogenase cytochrome subunit